MKYSSFLVPPPLKKRTVKIPKPEISNCKNVSPMIRGNFDVSPGLVPGYNALQQRDMTPALKKKKTKKQNHLNKKRSTEKAGKSPITPHSENEFQIKPIIDYESIKNERFNNESYYVQAPPEICDTETLAEDISLYCPSVEVKQSKFISSPQKAKS